MQGLADGYFVIPYTISAFMADQIRVPAIPTSHPAFDETEKAVKDRIDKLMSVKGTESVESFHKRLGKIMWNKVGMARNEQGLKEAIEDIRALRNEFWQNVKIPGGVEEFNPELDKAGRVADFLELGELMAIDALQRTESCGGHFREESQTAEGEALRKDEEFSFVAAWEYTPEGEVLHKEPLNFDVVKPSQRSYK
jgi:succinate dehydrogenase / fumarate reductase flavoprotein subunit